MPHQVRNPGAEAATAGNQRRSDPAQAWATAISSYQQLNGLRGFWPFSTRDESGNPYDLSGQGRTLTNNNAVPFGHPTEKIPVVASFTAASLQSFTRADEAALSITGALTLGCWIYFATIPASIYGLVCKWGTSGQRSYRLIKNASNLLTFEVSTGSTVFTVNHTRTVVANTWYFAICMYVPSTSISIYVGSAAGGWEGATNTSSIPASLADTTALLEIGRVTSGSYLDGSMGYPHLSATTIEEHIGWLLYQRTKPMFGL